MSAYMCFYIRANDKFYPIGTYSRSTMIYDIFEMCARVPWEKIVPIDRKQLEEIISYTSNFKKSVNRNIESIYEKIDFIQNCEADFEDKLENYGYCKETIEDYEEEIKELDWVINFADFLQSVIDDGEDTKFYDEIETIDPSKYVYAGIEIGCPTVEDIKED